MKKTLAIFCGFLAALFLFATILQLINSQKIIQGTTAAGQDFSGLTLQEAQTKLDSLISEIKKQKIEIKYKGDAWFILPEGIGINLDAKQTLQTMRNAGRNKNILINFITQVESLFSPKIVPLYFYFDENKFSSFLTTNLTSLENPPKNATLKFDPNLNDFIFVPARNGQIFDISDFKQQINEVFSATKKPQIALRQISANAVLTEDRNNIARIEAGKIIKLAPYFLNYNEQSWPIEKTILTEWLEFIPAKNNPGQTMAVSFAENEIKDFLLELAPVINKEPIDGKLTTQNDKVVEFSLSQNGAELKIDESVRKIKQEILATLNLAQTELSSVTGKKEIQLIVTEKPPLISTATIDTLGLTSLIGQGVSNFAGSPKNRIHNIGVGAAKISGLLIRPGEEFSFVKNIGEIEAKQGYLPELVIKNKKTVPEYGGGICQVSTTLFRAAINAGLKITERYAHAFPVKYYNPQGFDATIYPPNPDLKFLNDTPGNILIQSKIEGTKITFEIYGTKDDREVKVLGPTILVSNPDGSMKTVLYQEIWRAGVLERKDTFRSNYKSPALYPVAKNPLE